MILFGSVNIRINDRILESINIVVAREIRRKQPIDYFIEIISNYDIILRNIIMSNR